MRRSPYKTFIVVSLIARIGVIGRQVRPTLGSCASFGNEFR